MNKIIKIILVVLIIILLVGFFYPKKTVVGGLGGLIMVGQSAYLEEYSCLGIQRDFCMKCPDCGCDYFCYGLTYNKKCFNQSSINGKIEMPCR